MTVRDNGYADADRGFADQGFGETIREDAQAAYEAASAETQRMGEYVRAQATAIAERQKSGLARGIADVASHIRKTSHGFAEQPNIEDVVSRAAERVEAVATSIEHKSTAELYEDAENICRRYPVTVATCAVVLGALVSRSLKSAPRTTR
jgi:hypothetical protein